MAISSPNYTQFPNELLDDWQGRLEPSEFCVLAYIARHTFGWKREPVSIRYKEFILGRFAADGTRIDHGCGVKSSATITKAINHLLDLDLIRAYPTQTERGAIDATYYEVAVDDDATAQLRAVSGTSVAKVPALHVLKRQHFSSESTGTSEAKAPIDKGVKETEIKETEERNGTGAIPRRPASPGASLRWLKQYEPTIYEACMSLKAEYVALSGQDANKYTDGDCEKLIRKCGDALPEASAAMHAVWDFHWRDGTHPYRRPLKLSKVLELLPAFRRGELTPETATPTRTGQARGPVTTLTATATEMRESMHGIAFCPECDRVLPNHKQSCSKATGAQGGAA